MKFLRILSIITFLIILTFEGKGQLKSGDLIFQTEGISDFSKAISESTAERDSVKFVHVGIIEVNGEDTVVIEADPGEGVRIIPLEEFIGVKSDLSEKPRFIVKRLNFSFPVTKCLENAKSHLGEDYDWWYQPDNGKMYCSELVYDAFVSYDGTKIFEAKPMNFRAPDGNVSDFWVELFANIGETVPQDVPGTNPQDMSKDKRLIIVEELF